MTAKVILKAGISAMISLTIAIFASRVASKAGDAIAEIIVNGLE
jgi:hypothetical protein